MTKREKEGGWGWWGWGGVVHTMKEGGGGAHYEDHTDKKIKN